MENSSESSQPEKRIKTNHFKINPGFVMFLNLLLNIDLEIHPSTYLRPMDSNTFSKGEGKLTRGLATIRKST